MIDNYEVIFEKYKQYIEQNSKYQPKVIKYNTNSSTYFPTISLILSDSTNSDDNSIDKRDRADNYYFTTDIYTKDKIKSSKKIASQEINDELTKLTIDFFEKLNMRRTLCQYTPNLDTDILRRTLRHQCLINNRCQIIRR